MQVGQALDEVVMSASMCHGAPSTPAVLCSTAAVLTPVEVPHELPEKHSGQLTL